MKLKRGNCQHIEIEDVPFAKGGQGGIHKIITPNYATPLVAKLYFDAIKNASQGGGGKKIKNLQQRLEFMVKNNPFSNAPLHIKEAFVWPVDCLYDTNNNFLGFLMSLIDNSISLSKITNGSKLTPPWDKFNIINNDSFNIRLKVCYNVAQALAEMHKTNTYTMVDFKPDNMMLRDNGFVRMIDMDSIQISNNNKVLFNASVRTPEFSPPEDHLQKIDFIKDFVPQSWDSFSFGTLAYLAILNIHPFMGMSHKLNVNITSFEEYIAQGLFPHGKHKNDIAAAKPHANFNNLMSTCLQNLFIQCFDEGHTNPARRPSMKEWRDALFQEIKNNTNKKVSAGINQPAPTKKTPKTRTNQTPAYTPPPTYTPPPVYTPPPCPIVPVSVINALHVRPAGANMLAVSWTTSNCAYARLNNMNVPANGSQTFPISNTAYSLQAFDINGNFVTSAVHPNISLRINKFSHRIIQNAIIFDWQVSAATKVKINNQSVTLSGSMRAPLTIGVQTIEAEDANGYIITSQINISKVVDITRLDLSLNRTDAFIEWDTMNAAQISINGHKLSANGRLQIPLKTNTYTIQATDIFGYSTHKSITATINTDVKRFDIIENKHAAEIIWDTWYVKDCFLNGKPVPTYGSIKVPLINRDYTLKITDLNGQTHTITKKVNGSPYARVTQVDAQVKTPLKIAEPTSLKTAIELKETSIVLNINNKTLKTNAAHLTLNFSGSTLNSSTQQIKPDIRIKKNNLKFKKTK